MECIESFSYFDYFKDLCTVIVIAVSWCGIAGYVGCNLGKAVKDD